MRFVFSLRRCSLQRGFWAPWAVGGVDTMWDERGVQHEGGNQTEVFPFEGDAFKKKTSVKNTNEISLFLLTVPLYIPGRWMPIQFPLMAPVRIFPRMPRNKCGVCTWTDDSRVINDLSRMDLLARPC